MINIISGAISMALFALVIILSFFLIKRIAKMIKYSRYKKKIENIKKENKVVVISVEAHDSDGIPTFIQIQSKKNKEREIIALL